MKLLAQIEADADELVKRSIHRVLSSSWEDAFEVQPNSTYPS